MDNYEILIWVEMNTNRKNMKKISNMHWNSMKETNKWNSIFLARDTVILGSLYHCIKCFQMKLNLRTLEGNILHWIIMTFWSRKNMKHNQPRLVILLNNWPKALSKSRNRMSNHLPINLNPLRKNHWSIAFLSSRASNHHS